MPEKQCQVPKQADTCKAACTMLSQHALKVQAPFCGEHAALCSCLTHAWADGSSVHQYPWLHHDSAELAFWPLAARAESGLGEQGGAGERSGRHRHGLCHGGWALGHS